MATTSTLRTVTSADGTPIAYERTGSGPPLVLVHGTAGDHTRWELNDVRAALAEHHTVYAMDRRGRGGSGDAPEYELVREFEDVAAVIESIDEPANLLGHSHGAICALEAALLTDDLRTLVLYEPPVPWEIVGPELFSEETVSEMEALLEAGEDEEALVVFMRDLLELPTEQVDELRSDPSWQARVDAAHTLPREERAPFDYEWDPTRFAEMTTPTSLMLGGESPGWAKNAIEAIHDALPNSRIAVLEGEGHVAMNTAPDLFVDEVLSFLRDPS
jgi:pimeloyl-ACP methyl ester carboxylesterase